jgi:hypothetical protein
VPSTGGAAPRALDADAAVDASKDLVCPAVGAREGHTVGDSLQEGGIRIMSC